MYVYMYICMYTCVRACVCVFLLGCLRTVGEIPLLTAHLLSVSLPCGVPVDCLDNFTRGEVMEGDCAFFCDTCQCKQTATKTVRFSQLPEVVVLYC